MERSDLQLLFGNLPELLARKSIELAASELEQASGFTRQGDQEGRESAIRRSNEFYGQAQGYQRLFSRIEDLIRESGLPIDREVFDQWRYTGLQKEEVTGTEVLLAQPIEQPAASQIEDKKELANEKVDFAQTNQRLHMGSPLNSDDETFPEVDAMMRAPTASTPAEPAEEAVFVEIHATVVDEENAQAAESFEESAPVSDTEKPVSPETTKRFTALEDWNKLTPDEIRRLVEERRERKQDISFRQQRLLFGFLAPNETQDSYLAPRFRDIVVQGHPDLLVGKSNHEFNQTVDRMSGALYSTKSAIFNKLARNLELSPEQRSPHIADSISWLTQVYGASDYVLAENLDILEKAAARNIPFLEAKERLTEAAKKKSQ